MIEISNLMSNDFEKWDAYVEKSNDATFYHSLAWKKVIENSLRHKPYYLIAKENDSIKGILPLFLVKNLFFGTYLVSLPFANYGGICAENECIEKKLLKKAVELTRKLNADFLELRDMRRTSCSLEEDRSYATFIISLDSNPEAVWQRLQKKARQKIRKAIRSKLTLCRDTTRIDDYYRIYCHNVKRLGSPPFSKTFFIEVLRQFPDQTDLVFVEYKGKTIATDLVVHFKETFTSLCTGAYKEYFSLCPNNFICWKEIEYACKKRYRFFDFGRSPWNSGSFNFKKYWHGEPKQLYYHYYLNRLDKVPVKNATKWPYSLYTRVWRRLPFLVTQKIGPRIIKYLH